MNPARPASAEPTKTRRGNACLCCISRSPGLRLVSGSRCRNLVDVVGAPAYIVTVRACAAACSFAGLTLPPSSSNCLTLCLTSQTAIAFAYLLNTIHFELSANSHPEHLSSSASIRQNTVQPHFCHTPLNQEPPRHDPALLVSPVLAGVNVVPDRWFLRINHLSSCWSGTARIIIIA